VPQTLGTRNHTSSYTEADLAQAVAHVNNGNSIRSAVKDFGIPLGTLYKKVHHKSGGAVGGQTTLTSDEEERLVSTLKALSVWRCPPDQYDL